MGLAGFPERPIQDDDPLVCLCGATLGMQALNKNEARLAVVIEEHKAEHKRRLAHQTKHRTLDGKCLECREVRPSVQ